MSETTTTESNGREPVSDSDHNDKDWRLFVPDEQPTYIEQKNERSTLAMAVEASLDPEEDDVWNVLLTGPTGSGKTHLVYEVCHALGRPVITIQGADGLPPEHLIGYRGIRSDGHGGTETYWVDGLIPRAMRMGAVLYIDEPNALPDGIRFYVFSAMDHRRQITLAENDGEVVTAAPGFLVVGAMNEGAGYGGTTVLNHAFRDRFDLCVDLDYLDERSERKLLAERCDIDNSMARKIAEAGQMLRIASDTTNGGKKKVRTPISTRTLITWGRLVRRGLNPLEAAEITLVAKVPATRKAEREAVRDVLHPVFGDRVYETE